MSIQTERLSQLQKRDPNLTFRVDPDLDTVRHLRGNLAKIGAGEPAALRKRGLRFVQENEALFGQVDLDRVEVVAETRDALGGHDVVLQQYHGDIPVYGGSIRLHAASDGMLDTVSSSLFPDLEKLPQRPRVEQKQAVEVALRELKLDAKPDREPQLMVYRHEGKPRLVWNIQITDTRRSDSGRPVQWIVIVDAISGDILVRYDNVQTAGPVVGSATGYYSGAGTINAWFNDAVYQLRDTTRTGGGGPEIVTNDEDGASPSEDPDNNWNAMSFVPRHDHQGPEVDAHRYAGQVIDYYQVTHGRNSFNGAGATVNILAHVANNYSNGYWDGTKVNLGDGSGAAPGDDYECSDDWLAHELTHAYTQYTCALQYLNESGALNEAFSDIFAAFITGDWLVFEDTWLKPSAPAWRNMIDPTNGGLYNPADAITSVIAGHQPSHVTQQFLGAWDNGGVHVNSGIINNLFYLLTVGGTHTISGITVSGIGQAAAEELLFRCMSVALVGQPTATFLDFREEMLDACLTLYPTDLDKLTQVKNAFNAVGIGPDVYVRDNVADNGLEPYPGSYLYASPDVISRTATVADPATAFADLSNGSLWQNVEFGQDNFVYVRLQNRGPQTGDASINIYFIPATSFGNPAGWIHVGTLAEVGIAPGTVRIAGPLTFASALIPAEGHYCMIAVTSSALDPAPDHSLIASVSDYIDFVRNTNNMAYRNLDVVDDVMPGTAGRFQAQVQGFGIRDRFDLRFDLDRLPEGMMLRVAVPARAIRGAGVRGMKLVARDGEVNVYEFLDGRAQQRNLAFCGDRHEHDRRPGFDDVLVEEPFAVHIDYEIPKDLKAGMLAFPQRAGGAFALRQIWKGEEVGAVGLAFVRPRRDQRNDVDEIIDRAGRERIPVK